MKNLTISEAERLAGKRLDRRRKYYLWDMGLGRGEEVFYDEGCLTYCSGCCEYGDYGALLTGEYDPKRKMIVGIGCSECGYTGVRRQYFPVPVKCDMKAD